MPSSGSSFRRHLAFTHKLVLQWTPRTQDELDGVMPDFKINISNEVFITVTGLSIKTAKEYALISQDKKQPIS